MLTITQERGKGKRTDTRHQRCQAWWRARRDRPLWWAGGLSDVSEGCRTHLLLFTSGYQRAPELTHAHVHSVNLSAGAPTCTHKPFCSELDSTIGASVGQAYYSSPEGVVLLLTGRHKYSSNPSPRVNGCPSCSNGTYKAACAQRGHTVHAALSPEWQGRLWRLKNWNKTGNM